MKSFRCASFSGNPDIPPLIFEWDESSGAVRGPSAGLLRSVAEEGGTPLHPTPAYHRFSSEPLKSRTDLAAIIGYLHCLPVDLVDAYPRVCPEELVDEHDELCLEAAERRLF